MHIIQSPLVDCFVIAPRVFRDDRGYFLESFNQQQFRNATGVDTVFVQDNESLSAYGVIRGLHYQKGAVAQSKLVRAVTGCILDVVVDIRKESATYGRHFSIMLDAAEKKQLFVPKGFLHGFSVLSDSAIVAYKCDEYYVPDAEAGVRFDDPQFGIDWQIPEAEQIISEKDRSLGFWQQP